MSPKTHSGLRSSQVGYINSARKHGLTKFSPDTCSLRPLQTVTFPVPTAHGRHDGTPCPGTSLLELSMRQACMELGHSHSICLESLRFILDGLTRSAISSSRIEGIQCSLPRMGRRLTPELMTWFQQIQTKSSGHGVRKPNSHRKRRRS